jgi:hypothetical protein
MNIIFVSNSMSKPKTLAVWQVWLIALALVIIPVFITLLIILPQSTPAPEVQESTIVQQLKTESNQPQKHLDAYALMLGEMQARIMRLDAQTERLTKLAGNSKEIRQNMAVLAEKRANIGGPLELTEPKTEEALKKKLNNSSPQ